MLFAESSWQRTRQVGLTDRFAADAMAARRPGTYSDRTRRQASLDRSLRPLDDAATLVTADESAVLETADSVYDNATTSTLWKNAGRRRAGLLIVSLPG